MKNKKIISIVILTALLIVGGIIVYQLQFAQNKSTEAANTNKPKQIQITNITENSFTVSWITDKASTGFVKYGEDSQVGLIARDTRDPLTGESGQYYTHWVLVQGLQPNNNYAFNIQSEDQEFDNNGSPYTTQTLTTIDNKNDNTPQNAQGIVILKNKQPAKDTLIYIKKQGMIPLSTVSDDTGQWNIDLTQARTENGERIQFDNPQEQFEIFFQGGDQPNSTVSISQNSLNLVPEITLGYDYNYMSSVEEKLPEDNSGALFNLAPPLSATQGQNTALIIWSPKPDEQLSDNSPLFYGSAPQFTNISLELDQTTTTQVTTDERGYWQWVPNNPLDNGTHIFSASYSDAQGQIQTQTRNFQISSTTNPIATNTPTQTPSPSTIFEISPTATIRPSNTPTPTLIPTITSESQLLQATITPTPAIPVTGFSTPTATLMVTSIGLLFVGLILAL